MPKVDRAHRRRGSGHHDCRKGRQLVLRAKRFAFAVQTLAGHPLAGWRQWEVRQEPNGDLIVETFSVEHPFSYADQAKMAIGGTAGMLETWQSMLLDITALSGGNIVPGADTVLGGAYIAKPASYLNRIMQ